MNNTLDPYVLPRIQIVGGETVELAFNLKYRHNDTEFYLYNGKWNFAVADFVDRNQPIDGLNKSGNVASNASRVVVKLDPSDTRDLSGKYIYQLTLVDGTGKYEIPKQGILYVIQNINKDFIK